MILPVLFLVQIFASDVEFPEWGQMEKFIDSLLDDDLPVHANLEVHAEAQAAEPVNGAELDEVHAEAQAAEPVHGAELEMHAALLPAVPVHGAEPELHAALLPAVPVHGAELEVHPASQATRPVHGADESQAPLPPDTAADEDMAREFLLSSKRYLTGELPSSPKSVRHRMKTVMSRIDRMQKILMNMNLPESLIDQLVDCKKKLENQLAELQRVKSKEKWLLEAALEIRNFSAEFSEDFHLGLFSNSVKAAAAHAFLDKWLGHFLTLDDSKLSPNDKELVGRLSDSLIGLKRVLSDQEGHAEAVGTSQIIEAGFEIASWNAGFAALEEMEEDGTGNELPILADMCRSFLTVSVAAQEHDCVNVTSSLRRMRKELGELVHLIEVWRIRQLSIDSRQDEQRQYKRETNWSTALALEMGFVYKAREIAKSKDMTDLQYSAGSLCIESVRAMLDHYWIGKAPKKSLDSLRRQIYIAERRLFNNKP